MNLVEHYDNLYHDSILKITAENCETDPLLDSPQDNRLGITLLVRPNSLVKNNIQKFLNDLKAIEPDQYYYRDSDIHVTIMSIISCYAGFNLSRIMLPDYVDTIQKSITSIEKFEIEFKGITASPSSIMVQGFLKDNTLSTLRNNFRVNFKNSGLEQTIDKRYSIKTAHATVVRFRKALTQKKEYINVLNHYRNFEFGTFLVDSLELVYNDWYQRQEHVQELHRFKIN